MAKFYGKLGYSMTFESAPGVWSESFLELDVCGDFIQNTYALKGANKVNDDVNALYIISVVVDSYAMKNLQFLKYVSFNGFDWKISRVKAEYPRLIITLDGDPFEVKSRVPTDKESAERYANNLLKNLKNVRCYLGNKTTTKKKFTIEFSPINDQLLSFYLDRDIVKIRVALLIHNQGKKCNKSSYDKWVGIDNRVVLKKITSTLNTIGCDYSEEEKSLFNKHQIFNPNYKGITYADLSSSNLVEGKINLALSDLLSYYVDITEATEKYGFISRNNTYVRNAIASAAGRNDDPDIYDLYPEQTFAAEIFTLCRTHREDFNKNADLLYYEHNNLRVITNNTATYIYDFSEYYNN